jgi:prepilin-type processing-associated H-X9-DG protein
MELLVVIGIVALLSAMLMPALKSVREQSRAQLCASNLRQIGMAVHAYAGDNEGLLPPYGVFGSQLPATWLADEPSLVFGCSWYHGPILGQYISLANVGTLIDAKVKQVATCPSNRMVVSNGSVTASLGLNVSFFPQMIATPWPTPTLQKLGRPLPRTVAAIDGMERFNPGYGTPPPTYGVNDTDPGLGWSIGSPTSIYNWRKRHNGGANILFFDGHVTFSSDPRQEAQARTATFN